MGVFNEAIPDINLNDKDEPIAKYAQPVYIDDMFDPLFNKDARAYLKDKYKYPIYRTLAGFAEGLDNALVPNKSTEQWGIMGPGMGILSNFGRTMDKAGDFLIGGVTEGVNAFDRLLGADVEVNNPLEEIFVNDEDYSGQRLLASMANSMSKLAGGTLVDESDFRGPWAIPATGLELALDPGILGGSIARKLAPDARDLTSRQVLSRIGENIGNDNFKGALGDVAQLLSNYDDIMTRVAIDYAAPGLRPLVKKFAGQIRRALGNYSYKDLIDVEKEYINRKVNPPVETPPVDPSINQTDVDINLELTLKNIDNYVANIDQLNNIKNLLDTVLTKTQIDFENDIATKNTINEINNLVEEYNKLANTEMLKKINDTNIVFENQIKELSNTLDNNLKKFRQSEIDELNKLFGDPKINIENAFKDEPDYFIDKEEINPETGEVNKIRIRNPKYQLNNVPTILSISDALKDPKLGPSLREDISNLIDKTINLQETNDPKLRKQLTKTGAIDLGVTKDLDFSKYIKETEDGIQYDIDNFVDDLEHGVFDSSENDDVVNIVRNSIQHLIGSRIAHHPSFSIDMSTTSALVNNPEAIKLGNMIVSDAIIKAYPEMIAEMPKDRYPFANLNNIIDDIIKDNKLDAESLRPRNIGQIVKDIASNLNSSNFDINKAMYDYSSSEQITPRLLEKQYLTEHGGFNIYMSKPGNGDIVFKLIPTVPDIDKFARNFKTIETLSDDMYKYFLEGNYKKLAFNTKETPYDIYINKSNISIKNPNGTYTPLNEFIKKARLLPNDELIKIYDKSNSLKSNEINKLAKKTRIKDVKDYIKIDKTNSDNIYVDFIQFKKDLIEDKKKLKKKYKYYPSEYDELINLLPDTNTKILDIKKYKKILKDYTVAKSSLNTFIKSDIAREFVEKFDNYNNFNYKNYISNMTVFYKRNKGLKMTTYDYNTLDNMLNALMLNKDKAQFRSDLNYANKIRANATKQKRPLTEWEKEKTTLNLNDTKYDSTIGKQFKQFKRFVEVADAMRAAYGTRNARDAYIYKAADDLYNKVILPIQNRIPDASTASPGIDMSKIDYINSNGEATGSVYRNELTKYFDDNKTYRRSTSMNPLNNVYYILAANPDFLKNPDGTIDAKHIKRLSSLIQNGSLRVTDDTIFKLVDINNEQAMLPYREAINTIRDWLKENLKKTPIYENKYSPPVIENGEIKNTKILTRNDIRAKSDDLTITIDPIQRYDTIKSITKQLNDLENSTNYTLRDLEYEIDLRNKLEKLQEKEAKVNLGKNIANSKINNNMRELLETYEKYKLDELKNKPPKTNNIETILYGNSNASTTKQDFLRVLHDALSLYTNKNYKGHKNLIGYNYTLDRNIYNSFPAKERTPIFDSVLRYAFGSVDITNMPKNGGIKGAIDRLELLSKTGTVKGEGVLPFTSPSKYDPKLEANTSVIDGFKEIYKDNTYKYLKNINNSNPKYTKYSANNLNKEIANQRAKTEAKLKADLINLAKEDPNKFIEYLDNPPSYMQTLYDEVLDEAIGKGITFNDKTEAAFGTLANQVDQIGDNTTWRLFNSANHAFSFKAKANAGEANWLKNSNAYKKIQSAIENYKLKFKTEAEYNKINSEYINYMDDVTDDIVSGKEFLEDFIASKFRSGIIIKSQKQYNNLYPTIAYNVKKINDAVGHEVIKVDLVDIKNSNDKFLRYYLNLDNKYLKKDLMNLKKYSFDFKDIVYHKGQKYSTNANYDEIGTIFGMARDTSNEMLKTLGFESLGDDYFKHTLIQQPENAQWLNDNLYKGLDLDKLDYFSNYANQIYNLNGALRIRLQKRSLHGFVRDYNNAIKMTNNQYKLFSTNPEYIVRSQLTEGIYKNANFQIFQEMFINDNYKINQFCKNVQDIKDILFAKDANGQLGGNADNLELAVPKYDDNGKLIGFRRFNKYSDLDLENALKNEDTVLIPTAILAPLDRILRKDARMSNSVFRFINKLTLPFKYSILCNPGFLLGNISDAGLKILVSQSEKYGTSVKEEAIRLAKSAKQIMMINNNFDILYNKYLSACDTLGVKLSPEERIPSLITNNKTAYNKFINFVNKNDKLFTKKDHTLINAYMFLNRRQVVSVLGRNSEDFISNKSNIDTSDYIDPSNPLQRIIRGKMDYDPKTPSSWGIFMNNPIINIIMKKSEQIEALVRSTAFYNDLIHHYGSEREVFRQINNYMSPKKTRALSGIDDVEFGVHTADATHVSYQANFDYENMPDFMDIAATVIPFPTFFLKNTGYWLEMIADNPQILDKAIRIQQGLWSSVDDEELEEDEFKAEALGRGAIPMDVTGLPKLSSFFKGIYKPAPLNSLFSAFNLLQDPIPNIAYRMNPLFSPITSMLQDKEDVRYRPYNFDQYQKNIKKGDEEFSTLDYMFHRMNPYDRIIGNTMRIPDKINNGDLQLADITSSMFQPDF